MWEQRFSTPEYLFGTDPADFVRRAAARLDPASEILCLADGEGRNSVHLASIGHRCTAMEFAPSAIAKGRALAGKRGVDVNFVQADIRDWGWQPERFDAVMAIFIQFAGPDLRDEIFAGMIRTLRPGGLIFLHGYTPDQLELGTGGPRQLENLYTPELLTRAFAGLEILRLHEYEATLDEGRGHNVSELMRWMPPRNGISCAMMVAWQPSGGRIYATKINMLAIDLAKGSFQVCAIGLDGAVLYNRVLSRSRLAALFAEQSACVVAPKGPASLKVLEKALTNETSALPNLVKEMGAIYLEQIASLTEVIERLADELEAASKTDEQLRRLCTIPGIGPVTAGAIAAFAPDLDTFDSGRNFAAWLGLVPRQRSTGGKTRLGSVSKMGQTDIRRLLIVGAMSVIRWVVRKGGSANRWLAALVMRKPKMVAAVALANKMARMIWALTTKEQDYRMA